MTIVSRLSVFTAYAAFAFVGAIVLGVCWQASQSQEMMFSPGKALTARSSGANFPQPRQWIFSAGDRALRVVEAIPCDCLASDWSP